MNNDQIDLSKLKAGLDALYSTLESITNLEIKAEPISHRSLSGDHIRGGKIVEFESVGIKDSSSRLSLIVTDKGITTKSIIAEAYLGDMNVKGHLNVDGEITAQKLHVNEITSDIRLERTTPLEFLGDTDGDVAGKGLYWKGDTAAKRLVYYTDPSRIWISESVDIHQTAEYMIGGSAVLSKERLGSSVIHSNLVSLGTIRNLKTTGNLNLDEYIFYEAASQRLGLGTDNPNGSLSIASLDNEFFINVDSAHTKIGNWTASGLDIVTDDTAKISISKTGNITIGVSSETKTQIIGKLGINVKNPDCDISTTGPVRFQGKKQEVASEIPRSGAYEQGDVVWNDKPKPDGYVGWICVRSGTPGIWKAFGMISG